MRSIDRRVCALLLLLLTGCASIGQAPAPPEARAALAPTGKLRVGLYLGNPLSVVRDPVSQDMKGMAFELGREMARRLGVPFEPVVYPSVGALIDATKSGQWDVAFFLANPARAKDVDFTPAIVELELGYLVPQGSSIATAGDVDRRGVRVAVAVKGQADVLLSTSLKQATLVRAPGLAAVVQRVKSGDADAIAANKTILHELSSQLPGSRILDGRFAAERLAMAIQKGRDAGSAYARRFVQRAKSEGLVRAALERAGARGAVVAPME
ncbi:MAG: transporter substrate-binding domain-containing protein [Candidatus Rokubacteria bacterium]|nr:transporter substrate-binding domain-containing protein [Candidatus Rokubacteria bacterium]